MSKATRQLPTFLLLIVSLLFLCCAESNETPKVKSASSQTKATRLSNLLDGEFSTVVITSKLPADVSKALAREFEQEKLELANPGDKFNAGDVGLPGRRLIFAGLNKDKCFVHYESGGLALTTHLIIFELSGKNGPKRIWDGTIRRCKDLEDLRSALNPIHSSAR